MDPTDDFDIDTLHSVTGKLTDAIASIEPGKWVSATPCSGWNLTALVDHITGGNWFTVAILAGETSENAMTNAREKFAGGSAGRDAAIRSLHDQLRAFLRPEVVDQTWDHIAGTLSGREILRLRLHDLIVHSWDVAESLHPGTTLPDSLFRWGLDELAADDSLTAQHFDLTVQPRSHSTSEGSSVYLGVFGR